MSEVTMPKFVLMGMLKDAAELGAQIALAKSGSIKPYISKREAYRIYGRGTVERWIKEELISPLKDGNDTSKIRIDRAQIESVSKAYNRHTYKMVSER
jgi:hypothetical protein